MLLVRLALRNLFRHVRRTLLSLVVVVAGVWVIIIGQGFIDGLTENIIRAQVDTLSGHVLVRPADYPVGFANPVDDLITVSDDLAAVLDAEAVAWTTRVLFTPRAVKGGDALRVQAFGFEPGRDAAVFPRDGWQIAGQVPQTAADGVLVSRGVARLLQVEAGDRLVLKARTSAGALNALDVPVAGAFSVGNPALDNLGVFVPMGLAADLVRPGEARSHVLVRLSSRHRSEAVAERLREVVGERAEVATWQDETAELLRVQAIRQRALNLLSAVLLLLAALGILNTILMAAYERVREVGTLRSMGMTRRDVLRLFVIEGAFMGLLGGLLGALIGGGMTWYWSTFPIDLTEMMETSDMGTVPMSTLLYTAFQPGVILGGWAFGVVVSALASVYPAWVASNLAPAEAVRA